jgi:hypothetical protein
MRANNLIYAFILFLFIGSGGCTEKGENGDSVKNDAYLTSVMEPLNSIFERLRELYDKIGPQGSFCNFFKQSHQDIESFTTFNSTMTYLSSSGDSLILFVFIFLIVYKLKSDILTTDTRKAKSGIVSSIVSLAKHLALLLMLYQDLDAPYQAVGV